MIDRPTPREAAIRICRMFVIHHQCRAGAVLPTETIQEWWAVDGWICQDFFSGLEYGRQEGWLSETKGEEASPPANVTITPAGYRCGQGV
ncbi:MULTISPECIES: hypothetical protein [Burkholderiaceae]|uniref:Uncharacterized protein n=1 Tax=Caballeronia sordidicola TaxID=196367 RepID=A0A242MUB4_CABSO|nr:MULTISPECIES: hypothetical protein [Burkholderiaceae]AME27049.1 hypothetical protein AXG89_24190 [Burkholderia sp. PAMC 26561]AME27806.1 hypothetical protein AXG89_28500 [Burkholderia sp. PAMC 26561]OTP75028.1 hypothetical protein PAMC26577_14245 [Caballeronia sordidicola]